jgi:mono/diheme cytochrome c family protein
MRRSVLILLLAACGGAPAPGANPPGLSAPKARPEVPVAASDGHGHQHPATTVDGRGGDGAADPHAGHGGGGGDHMGAMEATRERLRATLGAAYDAPVAGLDGADIERGSTLFATHCATCHGANGKGDGPAAPGLLPPPANFTDAFHARYYSDAGRVEIIREGSPGTAMSPFKSVLNPQGVLDVYAYVRTLRGD